MSKHMKKCLISVAVKEIQIKLTVRSHYTCSKVGKTKMASGSKHWQECRATARLIQCWSGYKWKQPPLDGAPRKVEIYSPSLLKHSNPVYIYSRERGEYVYQETCTRMFAGEIFVFAKNWKQLNCHQQDGKL